MIHKAIEFAAKKHDGQRRKGTDVPFIVHPIEVMYYLIEAGADKDTVVAGLLHDIVEDTSTTLAEIAEIFGETVAELVRWETEDKTKTWVQRKAATIEDLKVAPFEALLICCADKLCNLKSIYHDMQSCDDVWARFTGTQQQTREYYAGIIAALTPLEDIFIYDRLVYYFGKVFGV